MEDGSKSYEHQANKKRRVGQLGRPSNSDEAPGKRSRSSIPKKEKEAMNKIKAVPISDKKLVATS